MTPRSHVRLKLRTIPGLLEHMWKCDKPLFFYITIMFLMGVGFGAMSGWAGLGIFYIAGWVIPRNEMKVFLAEHLLESLWADWYKLAGNDANGQVVREFSIDVSNTRHEKKEQTETSSTANNSPEQRDE